MSSSENAEWWIARNRKVLHREMATPVQVTRNFLPFSAQVDANTHISAGVQLAQREGVRVMDEYMPTTEEIREYIEVGGEPQPWLPIDEEKDARRLAAFDCWLTSFESTVRADQIEKDAAVAEESRPWNYDRPDDWTDEAHERAVTADEIAAAIRTQSTDQSAESEAPPE